MRRPASRAIGIPEIVPERVDASRRDAGGAWHRSSPASTRRPKASRVSTRNSASSTQRSGL